jgi:hypothetical protein
MALAAGFAREVRGLSYAVIDAKRNGWKTTLHRCEIRQIQAAERMHGRSAGTDGSRAAAGDGESHAVFVCGKAIPGPVRASFPGF